MCDDGHSSGDIRQQHNTAIATVSGLLSEGHATKGDNVFYVDIYRHLHMGYVTARGDTLNIVASPICLCPWPCATTDLSTCVRLFVVLLYFFAAAVVMHCNESVL